MSTGVKNSSCPLVPLESALLVPSCKSQELTAEAPSMGACEMRSQVATWHPLLLWAADSTESL